MVHFIFRVLQGTLIRCEINGQINMKSFLVGNPDIKLGLNEDITVGQTEQNKGYFTEFLYFEMQAQVF